MKNLLKRLLKPRPLSTLSSVDAYALWAEAYPAQAHNPLMKIEETAMQALMPALEGRIVLDLACGSGRYGQLARRAGAHYVSGFDNSLAMLAQADIDVALATTEAIPLASATIDIVLCGLALGHLPSLEASLHEIARILKPGGLALISDFHPFQYLMGARRTFASAGVTYAVEHHVHLLSDYFRISKDAGLLLTGLEEPTIENRHGNVPVVVVFRFQK